MVDAGEVAVPVVVGRVVALIVVGVCSGFCCGRMRYCIVRRWRGGSCGRRIV